MKPPRDLGTASREELLTIIAAQQQLLAEYHATIVALEHRVADLDRRLHARR